MNLSFRQLKAFVTIAEMGNFTKAAEKIHITQSGLSIMMREMESQLDFRLFERTTRTLSLTDAGYAFLSAVTHAVESIETSIDVAGSLSRKEQRILRIAAPPLISASVLPAVFHEYQLENPDVKLDLVDCDSQNVRTLVEDGSVDCGLGFFFQAISGLERRLLGSVPLVSVKASNGSPTQVEEAGSRREKSVQGEVAWSDLDGENLISLPSKNPIQQVIETHLQDNKYPNASRTAFNHFETIIAMVASRKGQAIIPSLAVPANTNHDLQIDRLTNPGVSLGLHRIVKRGRESLDTMETFTDLVVSMLPAMGCHPEP